MFPSNRLFLSASQAIMVVRWHLLRLILVVEVWAFMTCGGAAQAPHISQQHKAQAFLRDHGEDKGLQALLTLIY
jgi:hypothetical protein